MLKPGRLLFVVAVGHTLVAFYAYRAAFAEMFQDGLFNTVGIGLANLGGDLRPSATAAFFLIMAPFVGLIGYLVDRAIELRDAPALRATGWTLIVTGVLAVIVAPGTPF
jgi:hypothetical protein